MARRGVSVITYKLLASSMAVVLTLFFSLSGLYVNYSAIAASASISAYFFNI
ncbi:hypothetical protein BVRB_6g144430 [Beta vulgaris subsp. vulgaris]|nr:hypothetical protein BVRB_6g144430 [Beta vulgaris subsp. vulgaris]